MPGPETATGSYLHILYIKREGYNPCCQNLLRIRHSVWRFWQFWYLRYWRLGSTTTSGVNLSFKDVKIQNKSSRQHDKKKRVVRWINKQRKQRCLVKMKRQWCELATLHELMEGKMIHKCISLCSNWEDKILCSNKFRSSLEVSLRQSEFNDGWRSVKLKPGIQWILRFP